MIVILFDPSVASSAKEISADLLNAFHKNVTVEMVDAARLTIWPAAASWDDLLLVVYQGNTFPVEGNQFIEKFIAGRGDKALILPVAVDVSVTKPPNAAAMIKALPYDVAAKGINGRLVSRAGGMRVIVKYLFLTELSTVRQLRSSFTLI
jgi:hypothetical protein